MEDRDWIAIGFLIAFPFGMVVGYLVSQLIPANPASSKPVVVEKVGDKYVIREG